MSRPFLVHWDGQDDLDGSGLENYDVYVSTNGINFTPWLQRTTAGSAWFKGELGVTYSFYCLARDFVGNEQSVPSNIVQTTVSPNAPVLVAITNREVNVGDSLTITNLVSGTPLGSFIFSLGASAPAGATINPTNGIFHWTPTCAQASRIHTITVWVTDSGNTNLMDAASFMVTTRECVQPQVGHFILRACDSGEVPVRLISSVPLTNVAMVLDTPLGRLTNLWLETVLPEICANSVTPLSNSLQLLTFIVCSNQWLIGTQQVAKLHFTAACNQSSAFVNLQILDTIGLQPDGTVARNFAPQSGRVVIIGNEPLLEAFISTNGYPALVLYGQPGTNYVLEATSDLSDPESWQSAWEGILADLFQLIDPPIGAENAKFFRARRNP